MKNGRGFFSLVGRDGTWTRFASTPSGHAQWLRYYRGLVDVFKLIARDPQARRDRSHFAKGMRSVNYGRHVIFSAPIASAGEETVVPRIVHERRNLPALAYYQALGDQESQTP